MIWTIVSIVITALILTLWMHYLMKSEFKPYETALEKAIKEGRAIRDDKMRPVRLDQLNKGDNNLDKTRCGNGCIY